MVNDENDEEDSIKVPLWWSNGSGGMFNRNCLPISHPECTYNYIKNKLGKIPEKYGVYHPLSEKYKDLTKEELISKLIDLELTFESYFENINFIQSNEDLRYYKNYLKG